MRFSAIGLAKQIRPRPNPVCCVPGPAGISRKEIDGQKGVEVVATAGGADVVNRLPRQGMALPVPDLAGKRFPAEQHFAESEFVHQGHVGTHPCHH